MIDPPQITTSEAQLTATIRLNIPRAEIRNVMGPAMAEVRTAVSNQGLTPAGPLFSHHFSIHPDTFDFEVGLPLTQPAAASARVQPSQLPAATIARTVYHGPYDGLHAAWEEFDNWIVANGRIPAPDLIERYLAGPESSPDPANWRTELIRPLAG